MAINLDALGDGVTFSGNLPSTSAMTVMFSVKSNSTPSSTNQMFMSMNNGSSSTYVQFQWNTFGQWEVYHEVGSGGSGGTVSHNSGTWYDFAAVFSGSGASGLLCYYGPQGSGTLSTLGPFTNAVWTASQICLGWPGGFSTYFPSADYDNVKLFDRALTATELEAQRRTRRIIVPNVNRSLLCTGSSITEAIKDVVFNRTSTANGTIVTSNGAVIGDGRSLMMGVA